MITKYRLAKKVGITPTHAINILNRKEYASLPKAVAIELVTKGEIKVEDIVRPEVARALEKYLSMRCMSKRSENGKRKESLREQGGIESA